ncbi:MAG: type II toxin-antitoxin system RelE/ParE family toxin [Candidatus Brocadiaceae bacterium]|nr:type II toxin-antitoxin system RelE/ParE family toxin [Candidatus Brocadiaceae bacterium]
MYRVILQRQAERYYRRADKTTARRLDKCFSELEKDPYSNTRALKGEFKGLHRLRIGNLRVIVGINSDTRIVNVLAILPRGDIYKTR